jgi:hypothetical protein
MVHQQFKAHPEACLKVMAPYRDEVVVAVEWLFTWSWLADRWAQEGLPVGLGPALDLTALHGGKATHDPSAAQHIARRWRGGMLPQAYV